jgi:exonuclease III
MDPSIILLWNVHGLNSVARQDSVSLVVRADIICLQETKMQSCSRRFVLSLLGPDFDNNFVALPSVGASGGVLLAWRSKLGAIVDSRVDVFSVSVKFCTAIGDD